MRTITKTLYKFDELSEQAQQKAIEQFIIHRGYYDWLDEIEHSFHAMLDYITTLSFDTDIHDIDWNRYEFDIDTDVEVAYYNYYSEKTDEWYEKEIYLDDITGVRAYKWLVNNLNLIDKLYTIAPFNFSYHKEEKEFKYCQSNRTKMCFKLGELHKKLARQEGTFTIISRTPIVCKNNKLNYILAMPTGYCDDYIPLECFIEFQELIKAGKNLSVADYFQMIADRYTRSYNSEIEYQESDEFAREQLECNNYEFYENGDMY